MRQTPERDNTPAPWACGHLRAQLSDCPQGSFFSPERDFLSSRTISSPLGYGVGEREQEWEGETVGEREQRDGHREGEMRPRGG